VGLNIRIRQPGFMGTAQPRAQLQDVSLVRRRSTMKKLFQVIVMLEESQESITNSIPPIQILKTKKN
jgi:hypothetical protein